MRSRASRPTRTFRKLTRSFRGAIHSPATAMSVEEKLGNAASTRADDEASLSPNNRRPAVVVLGGSFNPVHEGHFRCLFEAAEYAERKLNYKVAACCLAPAHDGYLRQKMARKQDIHIPGDVRLRIISECIRAMKNSHTPPPFELPEPRRCFGSGYECGLHYRKNVAGFEGASRDSKNVAGFEGASRDSKNVAGFDGASQNSKNVAGFDEASRDSKSVAGFGGVSILVVVGADRAKSKWRRRQKANTETICLCREDTDKGKDTVRRFEEDTAHGRAEPGFHVIGSAGTSASSTKVRKVLRECFEDAGAGEGDRVDWAGSRLEDTGRLGDTGCLEDTGGVRRSIAAEKVDRLSDMGVCVAAQDLLFDFYLKNVKE